VGCPFPHNIYKKADCGQPFNREKRTGADIGINPYAPIRIDASRPGGGRGLVEPARQKESSKGMFSFRAVQLKTESDRLGNWIGCRWNGDNRPSVIIQFDVAGGSPGVNMQHEALSDAVALLKVSHCAVMFFGPGEADCHKPSRASKFYT
jgi:hypothetical protein